MLVFEEPNVLPPVVPADPAPTPAQRRIAADESCSLIEAVRARANRQQDVPLTHRVKCDPEPFNELWEDRKTCEVRVNDRDYRVGDSMDIVEHAWQHGVFCPTGRELFVHITHIQTGYGLPEELCVISFARTGRTYPARDERAVHERLRQRDAINQARLNARLEREAKESPNGASHA